MRCDLCMLLGLALTPLIVAALGVGSLRLQRRLAPALPAAAAVLMALVIALGLLTAVVEVLGLVGLLERGWLAGASIAAGLGLARVAGPTHLPRPRLRIERGQLLLVLAAAAAVLPVLALWAARSIPALRGGMIDEDSLLYHMPYAAHFAQSGSITGILHLTADPLSSFQQGELAAVSGIATFYPMTGALFHTAGIVLFGSDLISPAINLCWLLAFLLACFAFGERFGIGAACAAVAGGALVAATPAVAVTQAGEATDDVVGLFFLVAAVALLLHVEVRSRASLVSAAAAGLAVATKLSFVAPVLAVTVLYAWLIRPGAARMARWVCVLVAFAGVWYLRNLIAVGNPIPSLDVELGPIHLHGLEAPVIRATGQSIADFATDWTVWRTAFVPALGDVLGLGHVWPLVLVLAATGAVAGALSGGPALRRVVALVAIASAIAYVFTPATAGGAGPHNAGFFFFTLRYASPALVLGMLSLAVLPALRDRRRMLLTALLAAASIATVAQASAWPPRRDSLVGIGWTLLLALALLAVRVPRVPARLSRPFAAAVVAVAIGGLVLVEGHDVDARYRDRLFVGPVYHWAATVHHQRIGIAGGIGLGQYPLYGRDDSNVVRYVGRETSVGDLQPVRSCAEWRTTVNRGHYDYLVVSGSDARQDPIETRWTSPDPAASRVLLAGDVSVFRLTGPLDPSTCGWVRRP